MTEAAHGWPETKAKMQDERHETEEMPCQLTAQTAAFLRGALLLQEKWVLLIVHSLLGGSISFNELMRRGGVNTTTLAQRLNLLEGAGVLTKTIHSTMPPRTSYALTEAGQALRPVLNAIAEWGAAHLPAREGVGECPGEAPCGGP